MSNRSTRSRSSFPSRKRRSPPKRRGRGEGPVPRDIPKQQPFAVLPRQMGMVLPPQTRRLLRFQQAANLTAAATSAAVRFHTNCVNEFIIGGSDSPPGLDILGQQYNFYRIIGYNVRLEMHNNTAVNATAYAVNQVTDPGTTPSFYPQNAQNRHSMSCVLGPITAGSGHRTLSKKLTLEQITGSNAYLTADSYRGSLATIPLDQTWFGFAVLNNSLAVFVDVLYKLTITVDVVFYDPQPQLQ